MTETKTVHCHCGADLNPQSWRWKPTHLLFGEEVRLEPDDVMEARGCAPTLINSVGAYTLHEWHTDVFPRLRRTTGGRWLRQHSDILEDVTHCVLELAQEG